MLLSPPTYLSDHRYRLFAVSCGVPIDEEETGRVELTASCVGHQRTRPGSQIPTWIPHLKLFPSNVQSQVDEKGVRMGDKNPRSCMPHNIIATGLAVFGVDRTARDELRQPFPHLGCFLATSFSQSTTCRPRDISSRRRHILHIRSCTDRLVLGIHKTSHEEIGQ